MALTIHSFYTKGDNAMQSLYFNLYLRKKVEELGVFQLKQVGLYHTREAMNDEIAKMKHVDLTSLFVKKVPRYTDTDPKH